MNFVEKYLVKKVAHVTENVSNLDKDVVVGFARRMENAFNPFLFLA